MKNSLAVLALLLACAGAVCACSGELPASLPAPAPERSGTSSAADAPAPESGAEDLPVAAPPKSDEKEAPVLVAVTQTARLADGRVLTLQIRGHATDFDGDAPRSGYAGAVDVYDGGVLLQTIAHTSPQSVLAAGSGLSAMMSASIEDLGVEVVDFNFDGSQDLAVFDGTGVSAAFAAYSCYLWNPQAGRFERHEALSCLSRPTPVPGGVEAYEKVGYQGFVTSRYRWRDGMLVPWEVEQYVYPNFDASCIRHVLYRNSGGEMKLVEDRFEYDGFSAVQPDRPASLSVPPVITDNRAPELAKLADACMELPDFESPDHLDLKSLWRPLFDIAWANNDAFVAAGSGVSPPDLERLRQKYMFPVGYDPRNSGRFVRGRDLAAVARFLFGEAFRWQEPSWYGMSPEDCRAYGVCFDDTAFWTAELTWNAGASPLRQIPLSLEERDGVLVLETAPLAVFCGRIVYTGLLRDGASGFGADGGSPAGYLSEEGVLYLYGDAADALVRRFYTFTQEDGRYLLASIRTVLPE